MLPGNELSLDIEFATDSDFTDPLTMTIYVLAAPLNYDNEGSELTAFGGRKGKADDWRPSILIEFVPTDVSLSGSDWDNGHYHAFMKAYRENPYRRVVDATVNRVGRILESGGLSSQFNVFTDSTNGILPFEFFISAVSRSSDKAKGQDTWTATFTGVHLA